MNKKILIAIIIIVVIAGGLLLFSRNYTAPSQTTSSQNTQTSPTPETTAQQNQYNIIYTASGFSPANLTITAGTTVIWINNSGSNLSVNSDPHPIHTNYQLLNISIIGDGQSKGLTFDKLGTYGYHDHFNPGNTGEITVQ